LGKDLLKLEQKAYLGQGNILNGGGQQLRADYRSPEKQTDNSLYLGPAGSALGAGKMRFDGTVEVPQL